MRIRDCKKLFSNSALLLSIGLCQYAHAVDPYGTTSILFEGQKFYATIAIPRVIGDGYRISGTRNVVNCIAKAEKLTGSVPNIITHVRLANASLTIGGQPIYNYVYPESWGAPGGGGGDSPQLYDLSWQPHDAVFSSARAADQAPCVVVLTLTYEVKRQDTSEQMLPPIIAQVMPKAHNQVALWRTAVNDSGGPLSPGESALLGDIYADLSTDYPTVNHGLTTTALVELADLKAGLHSATGVFGVTHGSQADVTSSYGVGTGHSLDWVGFNPEISHHGQRYVSPPASTDQIPPTNLLFFYSCATLPGADNAAGYFWMDRDPLLQFPAFGPRVDSALMGFNVPIILNNFPSSNSRKHISIIFEKLIDDGVTVKVAVDRANEAYPPLGDPTLPKGAANMQVKGDPESTLYWVYVPASMRSGPQYAFKEWFYITTPPPPGN